MALTESEDRSAGPGPGPAAGPAVGAGSAVGVSPAATAAQRVAMPAEPFDRAKVFGGLLLCLAVCAIPMFVALGDADVTGRDEAEALLTSRETWSRVQDGQRLAWLIPSFQKEQAIDPPPMTTWLHLLSWTGLDAATADPRMLALRARCVSVAMALTALLATYWAGISIGGAKVGRLAALAMGTTLLFIHHARYATPDAVLLGFVAMSIAAGLWAMRPLKEINWVGRRVIGWLLAGAALAAAVMTDGPAATVFVLPPLIAAILLTPMRRASNTVGLIFAIVLGLVLTAPWYLYVLEHVPDAQRKLFGQLKPPRDLFVLTWSHFEVLIWLSPWVIWLFGALCQPFLRAADRARRRQLLIAWFWFVLLFIVLSIPASRDPRFLLPLMPAVGLMVGQLWAYHAVLASQRQRDPGVNLLRIPHWLLLGAASVLAPLTLAFQSVLVDRGWFDAPPLPGVDWPGALAVGAALLAVAMLGARWHFKWQPRLAAYATTAWMVIAASTGYIAFTRSPYAQYPYRDDAMQLARATAGQSLAFLPDAERVAGSDALDPVFVFYLGRHAAPVDLGHLIDPDDEHTPPRFVIACARMKTAHRLASAGFAPVLDFADNTRNPRQLYRRSE